MTTSKRTPAAPVGLVQPLPIPVFRGGTTGYEALQSRANLRAAAKQVSRTAIQDLMGTTAAAPMPRPVPTDFEMREMARAEFRKKFGWSTYWDDMLEFVAHQYVEAFVTAWRLSLLTTQCVGTRS